MNLIPLHTKVFPVFGKDTKLQKFVKETRVFGTLVRVQESYSLREEENHGVVVMGLGKF